MTTLDEIAGTARPGTLYGIGVGPGDLRCLTLRAAGLVRSVDTVAYFTKPGQASIARAAVQSLVPAGRTEINLVYPPTDGISAEHPDHKRRVARFYEDCAERIAGEMLQQKSVGVLCEGDPFLYGSFASIWKRLADKSLSIEVVPGVPEMAGAWACAGQPITWGHDVLTVLPATLDEVVLAHRLSGTDAAVVMEPGRHLAKVRRALEATGLIGRALIVERATLQGEKVTQVKGYAADAAPVGTIVIVPGEGKREGVDD